jgi:hypothetical protein
VDQIFPNVHHLKARVAIYNLEAYRFWGHIVVESAAKLQAGLGFWCSPQTSRTFLS